MAQFSINIREPSTYRREKSYREENSPNLNKHTGFQVQIKTILKGLFGVYAHLFSISTNM